MNGGLWSYPTDPALYTGTWVAMMAAMMLPAVAPTVLRYGQAVRVRRGWRTALAGSAVFAGAYLAVWIAAGVVPYAVLGLSGGLLMHGAASRYLAAGMLVAAAAYQLAPAKRASLRRVCAYSADGLPPLRTGLASGGWCLACCWGLMASLVALGMMNLLWMVLIWALVMVERFPRPRGLAVVGVAAILAVIAVLTAF